MTASTPRITATDDWTDITVAVPSRASVDLIIQNLDDEEIEVVFGGSKPVGGATSAGPIRLDTYDSVQGNAANIWVRGSGTVSATIA